MIALIYPAHALGAGVSPVFEVESEMDLIANSFLRQGRLGCLILGCDRRCKKRGEDQGKRGFNTEDTEARRTQRILCDLSASSVPSLVKLSVHSQPPCE